MKIPNINLFIKKTKEITSTELRLDATVKAYNIIFSHNRAFRNSPCSD